MRVSLWRRYIGCPNSTTAKESLWISRHYARSSELASSLIREDRLKNDPPDLIGGADVGFEQGGEVTRAAMVLLKYPTLELVEYKVARIATTMPYIPGFLSFRETPR